MPGKSAGTVSPLTQIIISPTAMFAQSAMLAGGVMLPSMQLGAASPSCAFSFIALTLVTSVGALRAPIASCGRLAEPAWRSRWQ